MPLRGADPVLSAIIRRCADTLAPSRPATWLDHFRQVLDKALGQDTPALHHVARSLALSPRTLQRRLAEHRTTWRYELDSARQRRIEQLHHPDTNLARLARQMGYSSPRSARRAVERWGTAQE